MLEAGAQVLSVEMHHNQQAVLVVPELQERARRPIERMLSLSA